MELKNINGWVFPDKETHFIPVVGSFPKTAYQQAIFSEAINKTKNRVCFIDVGANLGLHTVRAASLFNFVHSFEPAKVNYEALCKNSENFTNIKTYNVGLGEKESVGNLKIPKNSENLGSFSLKDFNNRKEEELFVEEINIKSLDSYELSPDLIKIDAQGYEVPILQGSIDTINKYSPVILIEMVKYNSEKITKLLEEYSYVLHTKISKDGVWVKK